MLNLHPCSRTCAAWFSPPTRSGFYRFRLFVKTPPWRMFMPLPTRMVWLGRCYWRAWVRAQGAGATAEIHANILRTILDPCIPAGARAGNRVCLRVQFNDYAGATLYHCHILDHSDLGMMATLQIV